MANKQKVTVTELHNYIQVVSLQKKDKIYYQKIFGTMNTIPTVKEWNEFTIKEGLSGDDWYAIFHITLKI